MTKQAKWHVGPAKTQISLGCPGLSESLLGAQSFCWFCHGDGGGSDVLGVQFLGFLHYLSSRPLSFSQKKLIFSM